MIATLTIKQGLAMIERYLVSPRINVSRNPEAVSSVSFHHFSKYSAAFLHTKLLRFCLVTRLYSGRRLK